MSVKRNEPFQNIEINEKEFAIQKELLEMYQQHPDLAAQGLLIKNDRPLKLAVHQRIILRDLWNKQFNLLVLTRGGSKCIASNSIVFTEDGMLEIGRLSNYSGTDEYLEEKEINVYSVDGAQKTSHWYCNGKQKTKKIKTNMGYNIEGTLNHPLIVMNEDGNIEYKNIGDIKEGDHIAIQRGQNYFGKHLNLPEFNYKQRTNSKKYNIPNKMTSDLARFLGYLIGDGNVTTERTIGFSNIDEDIAGDYKDIVYKLFGENVHFEIDKKKITHCFTSKEIREFLLHIGIERTTPHYKEVPEVIMKAPKEIVSDFIRALFDCNGSVNQKGVSFCTVSEKMANQLHVMLLNFGIISSLKKRFDKQKRHSFIIQISGENALKYRDEIGFISQIKLEKLNKLLKDRAFNMNIDFIPFQNDRITEIAKDMKPKERSRLTHYTHDTCNISYSKLNELFDMLNPEIKNKQVYKELKEVADMNIFWDKVKTIEDSEAVVYDFVVPGNRTFFANGFINHNTFLLALFQILKALLYPREKCITVSATYRQSKLVFDEVIRFYQESPLLREACVKPPTKGPDTCELHFTNGSSIIAVPIGDGTKIRGFRANTLVVDEVAQVDPNIIDLVLIPMLNTKQDPLNPESNRKNYFVMASSAYYQFNHLYNKYQLYQELTDPNNPKYDPNYGLSVFTIDDMPEGWADPKVIEMAKNTMTELQFLMEYYCVFPPDSDGFFPASLMNGARKLSVLLEKEGQKGAKYVFGIDPARSGDNFALCVLRLGEGAGAPSKVVGMYTLHNRPFPEMHDFIRTMIRKYEANGGQVVRIQMDNGGGGQTLRDLLAEEYGYWDEAKLQVMDAIIDMDNESYKYAPGRRILKMQVFNPQTINTMNFDLRADLEQGRVILPKVPPTNNDSEMDQIFEEIEKTIEETMTIVTTPLKSGYMHFDTPKTRMKKDRYTAFLLACEGARDYNRTTHEPPKPKLAIGFWGNMFSRK